MGRAVGELAVIVLGVWIALWADGWAAQRRDRARETAKLAALRDNVSAVLVDLREEREDTEWAWTTLRQLALATRPGADAPEHTLANVLLFVPEFHPVLSVYDDLQSSGELSLLTDDTLRRELSALDARTRRLEVLLADLGTVQQLNVDRYLIEHVELSQLMGHLIDQNDSVGDPIAAVVEDPAFRNLVLFKLDLVGQVREQLRQLDSALVVVEAAIRDGAR